MKGATAVVAAGSAFTGAAVGGLLIGVWLDHARHTEYFAVAGLFAGVALGGYTAFRLLVQTNIS